jgi:hypothetical protein
MTDCVTAWLLSGKQQQQQQQRSGGIFLLVQSKMTY